MKQNFTGSINGTQYDDFNKFLNDLNQLNKKDQIDVSFRFETLPGKTNTKEKDLPKEEIIKSEIIDKFEPKCDVELLKDSSFCGREIHHLDQEIYDKCKNFRKFLNSACLPLKNDIFKVINERNLVWGTHEANVFAKLKNLQTEDKEIQSELCELKQKYKALLEKKVECEREISSWTGIKVATLKINSYWRALKQIILNDFSKN